jgi:hypothetical protein
MLKALAWKEIRELLPLAALALLAQIYLITSATGTIWGSVSNWVSPLTASANIQSDAIPFVDSRYGQQMSAAKFLCVVAAAAGMCFGLWQTMWEANNGTFLFLLHRPMGRQRILEVKLLVGAIACLLVGGLPLLYYTLWAAAPATHASPFLWALTTSAWLLFLEVPLVYLGAFLSGLRPGRWFGSRFLPLFAAIGILYAMRYLPSVTPDVAPWEFVAVGVVLLLDLAFVVVILSVARSRDFA